MVMDSVSSKQTDEWIDLHRIGARESPKQAKNEIIGGNCNLSACDSVYRDIFVSHRETVRLN